MSQPAPVGADQGALCAVGNLTRRRRRRRHTGTAAAGKLNQAGRVSGWVDGRMDGEGYLEVGRGVAPRACPLRRHAKRGALLLLGAVQDHEEILCSSPAGDQASPDLCPRCHQVQIVWSRCSIVLPQLLLLGLQQVPT